MTLPRPEVTAGLAAELASFEQLVRSLAPDEATTPTRCAGWTVADVAAHVTGTLGDVVAGRLDGLGSPEVVGGHVADRRGRTPGELADEMAGYRKLAADQLAALDDATWESVLPVLNDITIGHGVEALWYDAYVHGDDIRAALGRPSERGPGLRASVAHLADLLARRGWGPATLQLDGVEPFDVAGGGPAVTGDAHPFVLAATGRLDPAPLGLDASVNVYAES